MMHFTVGIYLAKRLEDVGLRHCFMVRGDYNLVLLDEPLRNERPPAAPRMPPKPAR